MAKLTKEQKIEKALTDPAYRIDLLLKGDPDLKEIINAALVSVELIFLSAAEGAGLQKIIKTLHAKKANHQSCHM